MRINTVFSKKVSTGDYENETYTVTVEAESEFNHIDQIADFLFHQAREAVKRQLDGTAAQTMPQTAIPKAEPVQEKAPETREAPKPASGTGTPLPATEKQRNMIRKLLRETFQNGDDAKAWLVEKFGVDAPTNLSRRLASRTIEALLEKSRKIA